MSDGYWEKIDCPVCDGRVFSDFLSLQMKEFSPAARRGENLSLIGCTPETIFTYAKCRSCGFVTTNPRLSEAANATFYNAFKVRRAESILSGDWQEAGSALPKADAGTTVKMLRTLPDLRLAMALMGRNLRDRARGPLRMLEYGSGYGYMLLLARAFGIDIHGVELSQRRISLARSKGFSVGTRAEIPQDEFDIVISQSVIEHVHNLDVYLSDIFRCLRPGGIFICNGLTPDTIDIERREGRWKLVHPISHLNLMTPAVMRKLLGKYGFRIPGRMEIWQRMGKHTSVYDKLPHLLYGAIQARGADISTIAFKSD